MATETAQTLDRGLRLLHLVAETPGGLTMTEAADRLADTARSETDEQLPHLPGQRRIDRGDRRRDPVRPPVPVAQEAGPTVFSGFDADTDYFGSPRQQAMLNFRVRDLDAMLAQLRAACADVSDETEDLDGVGRFGWVTDPEGNHVELWQPS